MKSLYKVKEYRTTKTEIFIFQWDVVCGNRTHYNTEDTSHVQSIKNGKNTIISHKSTKDDNDTNYSHESKKINVICVITILFNKLLTQI